MRRRLSVILAGIMLMGSAAFAPVKADNDPEPTQITRLSSTSRKVRIGKKFEIKAYTELREFDEDCLVWSVSNAKVVKFEDRDRTGDDMDFIARKTGTANISCRIRGTDVKKTCKVKVIKGKVQARIAVDDRTMDVEKGDWEDIEARLVGGNYKNRKLTYKVSNKKIIRVRRGKVYGRRLGGAKITIRANADKKIKKVVYVRVERDD